MKRLLIAGMLTLLIQPAIAGGGGRGGDATEFTQILNNVELAKQTIDIFADLENQLLNTENLAQGISMGEILPLLSKIYQATQTAEGLAYSSANIDEIFKQKFPGYKGMNFEEEYKTWTATTMDTLRGTLNSMNVNYESIKHSEEAFISKMEQLGSSVVGRQQALQAGIQASGYMARQLQSLRLVMMQQTQAQTAYMAEERQQEASIMANSEGLYLEDLAKDTEDALQKLNK